MLKDFSCPLICTSKYAQTISFYEDTLDYEPLLEREGFAILRRSDNHASLLGVVSCGYKELPKGHNCSVQGMFILYGVDDIQATYDKMYMEGLNIITEVTETEAGTKHFELEDPNGVIVGILENRDIESYKDVDMVLDPSVVLSAMKAK